MLHFICNFIIGAWLFSLSSMLSAAPLSVHEYTLDNGIKLLVKEDHRAPIATFMIWYKVGSGQESNGITGISHALEHMMFKGTPQYPAGRFSKLIAQQGGEDNAFTSTDFTAYFEKIAAKSLPLSFQLEADRMQHLLLEQSEFAKEIEVVKEERRLTLENDPQALLQERFNAAAHLATPYHHPIIGWMNDLENLHNTDLQKWYQTWYAPNNAIIVVVGDVTPEKMLTYAQKYFGAIPKREIPQIKPQREPPTKGTRNVTVKAPANLPYLVLGFNVPSLVTAEHPEEAYALTVAAAILDGGDSARLSTKLIRGKQLALQTSADYSLYNRFDTLFTLDAVPIEPHTTAELQEALLAEIKLLQTEKVTQAELDRNKAQVIAEKTYRKDSLLGQATEIGMLESVGLSWRTNEEFASKIAAVTPEQIQEVAKKYLTAQSLTVAQLVPLPMSTATQPNNHPLSSGVQQ